MLIASHHTPRCEVIWATAGRPRNGGRSVYQYRSTAPALATSPPCSA